MSGEPREKTRYAFLNPPVDGLQLTQPNYEFDPTSGTGIKNTEATVLQNYLVYDGSIYERGAETLLFAKYFPAMFPFYTMGGTQKIIAVEGTNKVYLMASPTDATPSDITGAVVITDLTDWILFNFNKYIFGMNEVDAPWSYSIVGAANVAATGLTGPTLTQLATGWNFKNRAYFLEGTSGNPTKVWYTAVGAITGAMTSIDYAQVLDRPGYLLCGFSWGYNQGTQSDELMVLISNSGEILFYSGDWPAADNIQLIARAQIPKPSGRKCLVKIGQEVLISTARGVIPLSKVFSGRSEDVQYFSTSRNLGNAGIFADRQFVVDPETPFLFGGNNIADSFPAAGTYTLYAQNYETGAWSTLQLGHIPYSLASAGGYLLYSDGTSVYNLNIAGIFNTTSAGENTGTTASKAIWTTAARNFGNYLQKRSNYVRPRATTISGTLTVTGSINGGGSSTTATDGGEINPPGLGKTLSYTFTKTPAGERGRLSGAEICWEEGGNY